MDLKERDVFISSGRHPLRSANKQHELVCFSLLSSASPVTRRATGDDVTIRGVVFFASAISLVGFASRQPGTRTMTGTFLRNIRIFYYFNRIRYSLVWIKYVPMIKIIYYILIKWIGNKSAT